MPQNELMIDLLRRNVGFLEMTLGDMTDADLLQRPVPGANNALWQLGHLISAEASMINACAGKTVVELPAGFVERFKKGTASVDDPAALGTKADLLALLKKGRTAICEWVGTLSQSDLARPAPENMQSFAPTVAHLIFALPVHIAMHVGQFQVIRRKLGKPVLF